ncbi:MAG: Fur family transcriptional regulator [Acetivibrionales bacterium]
MAISFENLQKELKNRSINLSFQRLKVLEYLANNLCHPTVDQIYTNLQKNIPTLSKTTVYNSLKKLADEGLIRVITIEDNETRYDINTHDHGHFKCETCGEIFDFNVNMDSLSINGLENFKVFDRNIYFNGICPRCLKNTN